MNFTLRFRHGYVEDSPRNKKISPNKEQTETDQHNRKSQTHISESPVLSSMRKFSQPIKKHSFSSDNSNKKVSMNIPLDQMNDKFIEPSEQLYRQSQQKLSSRVLLSPLNKGAKQIAKSGFHKFKPNICNQSEDSQNQLQECETENKKEQRNSHSHNKRNQIQFLSPQAGIASSKQNIYSQDNSPKLKLIKIISIEQNEQNDEDIDQQENQQNENQNENQDNEADNSMSPEIYNYQQQRSQKLTFSFPQFKDKKLTMSGEIQNKWVLLPNSKFKRIWNIMMIIMLLYSAIFIPFKMAFIEDGYYFTWDILDYSVDAIFFLDLIFNFLTPYYHQNYLVTNNKKIALNYLKGWFIIDLISCFPFASLTSSSQSRYAGISRLPRIYKLLKMPKLARIFKVLQEDYQWQLFNHSMSISLGQERVILANFILILSCHIVSCIFFLTSSLELSENSWIKIFYQYVASLYWTVQTVLTVGYGDINCISWNERLFAIFWMLLSVYLYSFAISSITSLLERLDVHNQSYLNKINILKNIAKDYSNVTKPVMTKIQKYMKYGDIKQFEEKNEAQLIKDLPNNLAMELSSIVYKELIEEIEFFQGRLPSFISFIAPLFTTLKVQPFDYIFMQGDPAEEMYFIKSGKVAAIIPEYKNFNFLLVNFQGSYFGETDILFNNEHRIYTFRSATHCELYVLSKKHFKQVFLNEFRDIGFELVQMAVQRLEKLNEAYNEAVEFCQQNYSSESSSESDDSQKNQKFKRGKRKFITQRITKKNTVESKKENNQSQMPKIQLCPFIPSGNDDNTPKIRGSRRNTLTPQVVDFLGYSDHKDLLTPKSEMIKKIQDYENEIEKKNCQFQELKIISSFILQRFKEIQISCNELPNFFYEEIDDLQSKESNERTMKQKSQQKAIKKFQEMLKK